MSLLTSAVGFGSEQPLNDLLELRPDLFFPDKDTPKKQSFLKISDPSSLGGEDKILERLTRLDLDLTRISDRLLVMGRCWNFRTDREACRNNIDEVACFLNAHYEKNYLIFNFSSPDLKYDIVPFRNQVVSFPTSKMLTLTVKTLFTACRVISAWLRLSKQNVAIIQCKNGKSRSGLVVACLLKYCGLFDTAQEAFDYFRAKRCPADQAWVSVTLRRYLRYFNDILTLDGRVPSSFPLKLHQVILTSVPDFNGLGGCDPGIEVYQEGRLVYSSAIRLAELNLDPDKNAEDEEIDPDLLREFKINLVLNPDKFDPDYNPLVMMDAYNIIFRLADMSLEGDVQVRVYHHNAQAGQNVTIFNLAFNTGFMVPGIVRLRLADFEIPSADTSRFDPDFAVDLVVTPDEVNKGVVEYPSHSQRSYTRDLMKLSQCHPVRPDPLISKPLELQGHRKFFVKLALQLGNNDIHAGHEFLATLSRSPQYTLLDRELTELTRAKYEAQSIKAETPKQADALAETPKNDDNPKEAAKKEKPVNPILEALKSGKLSKPTDEGGSTGGLPFLAGLLKATAAKKLEGELVEPIVEGKEEKPQEEESPSPSGQPFLAGLLKATAARKNVGELKETSAHDDGGPVPSGGPPFAAAFLKATASRKKLGEAAEKEEALADSPPPKGPPFLAGLMKATAKRKDYGELPDADKEESEPKPTGGPPFLAGLMKATAGRKNVGVLEGSEEALPKRHEPIAPVVHGELVPINPNPPTAPPLPGYLRHPKQTDSPLGSSNIDLSVADELSRMSSPPPFGSIPPPPPFPPKAPAPVVDNKQKIKNSLHWSEIRDENKIRNTIWSELRSTESHDEKLLDLHKFEELFCVNPLDEPSKLMKKSASTDSLAKNVPSILDSRRANNVGIGLSRFYKRMTNEDIINAMVFQKHLLDINDLMSLKAILPTDDERQQLALFRGDPKALVPSEQFMLEMLKLPSADWILDALLFEAQFQGELESLTGRLSLMTAMLTKIRESPGLKTLFKLVLELGNLASYDYGRVPAHMRVRGKALGFTMDSLLKLHEVKSVDRMSSLLNYLIHIIEEKNSELLTLPAEFFDLSTIKHYDSNGLYSDIDALKATFNRISNLKQTENTVDSALVSSFRENQAAFLALARTKLAKLESLAEALRSAWTECAGYLGEDPDDKKPEELMIVFDQFFRHFKEAHEQNQKALKAASRSASSLNLRIRSNGSGSSTVRSEIPSRMGSPLTATESVINSEVDTVPDLE